MFETKQQCVANCLKTEKGSHALFRGIGVAVVDSPSMPFIRRSIHNQITKYFPDVNTQSVSIDAEKVSFGQFSFNINLGDAL